MHSNIIESLSQHLPFNGMKYAHIELFFLLINLKELNAASDWKMIGGWMDYYFVIILKKDSVTFRIQKNRLNLFKEIQPVLNLELR